jgi:hypothetical protein
MKGFKLKEVCTTEKGTRYVATTQSVDDRWGWETFDHYGIQLMPEDYSNEQVKVGVNTLSFCGYEVLGYDYWVNMFNSLSHNIPRYYVIRKYDEERGYHSFQGGFDLLNDGRAWEGITRTEYDSISDALKFVRERVGDDFTIHLEEPMLIVYS